MSKYHNQTLALLDFDPAPTSIAPLLESAKSQDILLPESFIEWAQLGGQRLLCEISNSDRFFLNKALIEELPDGRRGLLFQEENQGSFIKIVLLDHGDDPPVLYSWIGSAPPWVEFTSKFSDAVFAQIFDHQYLLEFEAYTGNIKLRIEHCPAYFEGRFTPCPSSTFTSAGTVYSERRWMRSPTQRVNVTTSQGRPTWIQISGPEDCIGPIETELLEAFNDHVVPKVLVTLEEAFIFLDTCIQEKRSHLHCLFARSPDLVTLARLHEFHRAKSFRKRFKELGLPWPQGETLTVSDPRIGFRFDLIKRHGGWYFDNVNPL